MDLPAPPLPPPPLLPPADAMCFCRTALPGLLAAPAAAEASARRDDGRDESSPLLGRRAARSLRIRLLSVDGGVGVSRQRPGPVGLSMPGTGAGAARFIPFHWSIMMACITHRSLARSLARGVRSLFAPRDDDIPQPAGPPGRPAAGTRPQFDMDRPHRCVVAAMGMGIGTLQGQGKSPHAPLSPKRERRAKKRQEAGEAVSRGLGVCMCEPASSATTSVPVSFPFLFFVQPTPMIVVGLVKSMDPP